MVAWILAVALATVEVERVLALVNGVPVLASDLELAQVAQLVPAEPGEAPGDHQRAVVEALVALELRWQDLQSAGVTQRLQVDVERAWTAVVERAGGVEAVRVRLAATGLGEGLLRELVRRAAVVQAYVNGRFAPFVRPTDEEIGRLYHDELVPGLPAGTPPPDPKTVRPQIEALLRERKLLAEVDRWTRDLETRGEVVRYLR